MDWKQGLSNHTTSHHSSQPSLAAHPPSSKLRLRPSNNTHGAPPWGRCVPGFVWGDVEAAAQLANQFVHFQESEERGVLAGSMVSFRHLWNKDLLIDLGWYRYMNRTKEEREKLMKVLVELMREGKVRVRSIIGRHLAIVDCCRS